MMRASTNYKAHKARLEQLNDLHNGDLRLVLSSLGWVKVRVYHVHEGVQVDGYLEPAAPSTGYEWEVTADPGIGGKSAKSKTYRHTAVWFNANAVTKLMALFDDGSDYYISLEY